jgi:hypothetical protein
VVLSPPSVQITGLNSCGCAEGQISISYTWTNLPTGSIGRLRVIVNGVVYEDTTAPVISGDNSGSASWPLHFDNGGGTATGTWPLPSGQQVEILFTDELPLGTIVTGWESVLDSCSGSCVFSTSAPYNGPSIPATSPLGLAALVALLLIAGVIVLLRVRVS